MQIWTGHINLKRGWHTGAVFASALSLLLLCGCQTDPKTKLAAILRVHIEVTVPTTTSESISVLRSSPVLVTILKDPVLDEGEIVGARLVESQGGYAVQIQFNDTGMWILQQYSAANPGKHFVIFGRWGEKLANARWLAAPLITRRIPDGTLTFTADASREEADQLVTGLNNLAIRYRKSQLKTQK